MTFIIKCIVNFNWTNKLDFSKKEIFSLSFAIREKRDDIKENISKSKKSLNTKKSKKSVIPIKTLLDHWIKCNIEYDIPKPTEL